MGHLPAQKQQLETIRARLHELGQRRESENTANRVKTPDHRLRNICNLMHIEGVTPAASLRFLRELHMKAEFEIADKEGLAGDMVRPAGEVHRPQMTDDALYTVRPARKESF